MKWRCSSLMDIYGLKFFGWVQPEITSNSNWLPSFHHGPPQCWGQAWPSPWCPRWWTGHGNLSWRWGRCAQGAPVQYWGIEGDLEARVGSQSIQLREQQLGFIGPGEGGMTLMRTWGLREHMFGRKPRSLFWITVRLMLIDHSLVTPPGIVSFFIIIFVLEVKFCRLEFGV